MNDRRVPKSLQELLDEPKGKVAYASGQAFILHVFWEAPSMAAAEIVLNALKRCAYATERDTPCVPTYFFRISTLDGDIVPDAPVTIEQHPQLQTALKKLRFGVPRAAVASDLIRRGIDSSLMDLDGDSPLPTELSQKPVILECTEIYLDQRAFYEHAGSRDYLDAYGTVMKPGLQNKHATVRLGAPTADIMENILQPMLNEQVEPVLQNCRLWRRPFTSHSSGFFIALSVTGEADQVAASLPSAICAESTTCIVFPHPWCKSRVRVICVFSLMPDEDTFRKLSLLQLRCVEVYCGAEHEKALRGVIAAALLQHIAVFTNSCCGYLVHPKAYALTELSGE